MYSVISANMSGSTNEALLLSDRDLSLNTDLLSVSGMFYKNYFPPMMQTDTSHFYIFSFLLFLFLIVSVIIKFLPGKTNNQWSLAICNPIILP